MKKIIIGLFLAAATLGGVTSCDMDLVQPNAMTPDDVTPTVENLQKLLTDQYAQFRGICGGGYVTNVELQMDQFCPVEGYGFRGGEFSLGNIQPSNGGATGAYNACYGVITNINYFMEKAELALQNEEYGEAQKNEIRNMVAQSKFFRAYFYWYLVDHFCPQYTGANGDEAHSGVPVLTKYNPSPSFDRETYVGRNTLNETFALIDKDLEDAFTQLYADEGRNFGQSLPNTGYLNACVVRALQARIALYKGQYQQAVSYAKDVIGNSNYRLCSIAQYPQMWSLDESPELIFVASVPASEYGSAGSFLDAWSNYQQWNSDPNSVTRVDYVPLQNTLYMYDAATDIRYSTFFQDRVINIAGTGYRGIPCFVKYHGNDQIWGGVGTNYFRNKQKPFRLSEQYLIRAEANAMLGNYKDAKDDLHKLRAQRINGYVAEEIDDADVLQQVIEEREKELIGEGFRMSDLRRWGRGFERSGEYDINADFAKQLLPAGVAVKYEVNDYRFVWPIPMNEMDVNPKMVQNRGYGN